MKILDNNLADVMNGNITPEEAAANIEEGWNDVTEDDRSREPDRGVA